MVAPSSCRRISFTGSTRPVSGLPARLPPRVKAESGRTVPLCATRTAGVRIAVSVSRWSTSASESTDSPRAGSVRWTCTDDAQTLSRKVWASPVSRSRALRATSRPCRRRRSSRRPWNRSSRRPCRPRPHRRCRPRRSSRRPWNRSSRRPCRPRPHRPCRPRLRRGPERRPGSTPSVVISSSPSGLSGVVVMVPPCEAATDGPPRLSFECHPPAFHQPTPQGLGHRAAGHRVASQRAAGVNRRVAPRSGSCP